MRSCICRDILKLKEINCKESVVLAAEILDSIVECEDIKKSAL